MDFKDLQNKAELNAKNYCQKYNVKIDEDLALLKLYEEMGELAQAIIIHRKKCRPEKYLPEEQSKQAVAHEFADVLCCLIVAARLLDIDLEDAVNKKWQNL